MQRLPELVPIPTDTYMVRERSVKVTAFLAKSRKHLSKFSNNSANIWQITENIMAKVAKQIETFVQTF